MKPSHFVALLLAVAALCLLPPAQAQRALPLQWSTNDGSQYLEANGDTLHLLPRPDSKGPRTVTATAKLHLPDTQKWEVSFDIRFGVLKDMASSLHIMRGDTDIGWVGADGVWNGMGIFVGKSGQLPGPHADLAWHHLDYTSDGDALIVSLDGKQVSSVPIRNENIRDLSAPDRVYLDNGQDLAQPCSQTGVWVRNVQAQGTDAQIAQSPAQPTNSPASSPQQAQLQKTIDQQNALIAALKQQIAHKHKPVQVASRYAKLRRVASAKHSAAYSSMPVPTIVFFDDFSDSRRTSMQWQETSNGGSLAFTGSSLQLSGDGTGCPHFTSRNSPFPTTGNWTATFAFRFTRIAMYGTDVGLGKVNGDFLACVHQDQTNQYLQMNGKNLATRPADTEWHVASFVKKSGTLTIYLDGAKVGGDTIQDVPESLQFGGGHTDTPGAWNNQEVQFVRVDKNEKVLDRTALLKAMPLTIAAIQTNKQDSEVDPSVEHLAMTVDEYNHLLLQVRALMRDADIMGEEGRRGSAWLDANPYPYASYALTEAVADKATAYLQQALYDLHSMRPLLLQAIGLYNSIKYDPNLFVYYQHGDFCTTASYVDADLGMLGADNLQFLIRVRQ